MNTAPAFSPEQAAVIAGLGLPEFRAKMLTDLLLALPPVVPGQHASEAPGAAPMHFEHILALEDILSACGVFTNMVTGQRCAAASYGTIFGFKQFEVAMQLVGVDRFSRSDWTRVVRYYRHNGNLSPVLSLVAAAFARFAGLPSPLADDFASQRFYALAEGQ